MASNFPCPEYLRDCECELFPVRNFSQEEPDVPVFVGTYTTPPITGTFFAPGCLAICESTVSQDAADDCAAAQAMECSLDGAPEDGNPLPQFPAPRFGNAQQECDAECPDSTCTQTSIIAPSTVISAWQADADARAASLACQRAENKLICFLTSSPLPAGNADAVYATEIVTFGGLESPAFSISAGALPTGLTLDASTGDITGIPTAAATYNFTVQLTTSVATCSKAYSIEIAAPCDALTDWCSNPVTCRVRIQNFDSGDWVAGTFPPPFESNPCDVALLAGWDGTFPFTVQKGPNPCLTYRALSESNPAFDLDYDSFTDQWSLNFTPSSGTMYFALGPFGSSPLGVYTRDPDFSCTGPAVLTLEAYTP